MVSEVGEHCRVHASEDVLAHPSTVADSGAMARDGAHTQIAALKPERHDKVVYPPIPTALLQQASE